MYERIPFANKHEIDYHKYHVNRLKFAFNIVKNLKPQKTLEIGAWTLTYWMRHNKMPVDTLGFPEERLKGMKNEGDADYSFHLRNIENTAVWLDCWSCKYDVVLACEVIEHLPFSLSDILYFMRRFLKPGGRLIIQTPNGVALKKRIAMMFGNNPFNLIKKYSNDTYDHLREPTIFELINAAREVGFEVEQCHVKNYFDYSHSWKAKLYELFGYLLPSTFKDGITLVLKRI